MMNDYQVAHNWNHYIKLKLSIKAKNSCEQFIAFDFQKSSHCIIIIEKDLLIYIADRGNMQNLKLETGNNDSHERTTQIQSKKTCRIGRRKIWTFKLLCSHVGKVSSNLLWQGGLHKKLQLIAKSARLLKFLLLIRFKDKSTSSSITAINYQVLHSASLENTMSITLRIENK